MILGMMLHEIMTTQMITVNLVVEEDLQMIQILVTEAAAEVVVPPNPGPPGGGPSGGPPGPPNPPNPPNNPVLNNSGLQFLNALQAISNNLQT